MDKKCYEVLKELYKEEEIERPRIASIVGWENTSQPNEYVNYLIQNGYMKEMIRNATPDGEGGVIPESCQYFYKITIRGKEEVEKKKSENLDKALGLASNLLP